jgi:hypothetical protein
MIKLIREFRKDDILTGNTGNTASNNDTTVILSVSGFDRILSLFDHGSRIAFCPSFLSEDEGRKREQDLQ